MRYGTKRNDNIEKKATTESATQCGTIAKKLTPIINFPDDSNFIKEDMKDKKIIEKLSNNKLPLCNSDRSQEGKHYSMKKLISCKSKFHVDLPILKKKPNETRLEHYYIKMGAISPRKVKKQVYHELKPALPLKNSNNQFIRKLHALDLPIPEINLRPEKIIKAKEHNHTTDPNYVKNKSITPNLNFPFSYDFESEKSKSELRKNSKEKDNNIVHTYSLAQRLAIFKEYKEKAINKKKTFILSDAANLKEEKSHNIMHSESTNLKFLKGKSNLKEDSDTIMETNKSKKNKNNLHKNEKEDKKTISLKYNNITKRNNELLRDKRSFTNDNDLIDCLLKGDEKDTSTIPYPMPQIKNKKVNYLINNRSYT